MGHSRVGQRIGHIHLDTLIGEGGMGEVYRGFDDKLQRSVAVKVLSENRRLGTEARSRLLREARTLSQLDHPGICRIFDLIEDDGTDVLVLEHIDGRNLGRVGFLHLDRKEQLRIARDIADALGAAHREGIVHRDLKPDNVMLTSDGQVKVLDFGIARSVAQAVEVVRSGTAPPHRVAGDGSVTQALDDDQDPDLAGTGSTTGWSTLYTREGAVVGTVSYMSPEQAEGAAVTEASDMYSLGIMFQELFTGQRPYGDAQGPDLLLKVYRAEAAPVTGVDPDLAALLERLKRIDPATRPGAEQTAQRLQWIHDKPQRARTRRLRAAVAAAFVVVVVTAIGGLVHTRIEADRRAAVAQRLSQQAEAMAWLMRAEHMSPRHDIRPAKEEVRRRMAAIAEQMEALGEMAAGPGAHALAQGSIALGDYHEAASHLDRAWEVGYRLPEVAYARGLVLGELYRQELEQVRLIADEQVRSLELERARRELRAPALAMLTEPGVAEHGSADYVEALIATFEERFEDALASASAASRQGPWFYEARVLAGDALTSMSMQRSYSSDARGEADLLARGLETYREALDVARSDPSVAARLCSSQKSVLWAQRFSQRKPVEPESLTRAIADCDDALAMDPDLPMALSAKAWLLQLASDQDTTEGRDRRQSYEEAVRLATRAIELTTDHPRSFAERAMIHLIQALYEGNHGLDCEASYRKAIADYARSAELSPRTLYYRIRLAETYGFLAGDLHERGKSPAEALEAGIAVLERAMDRESVPSTVHFTVAGLYFYRAQWQASLGEDALDSFEQAAGNYRIAAEEATRPTEAANLALVLVSLGDYLLGEGRDPTRHYRDGVEQGERALALSSEFGFIHFVKGLNHLGLARCELLTGGNPAPEIELAMKCHRRGLELSPGNTYAYPELAQILNLRAEHELRQGRSPEGTLAESRTWLDKGLRLNPGFAGAHRVAAATSMIRARWALARGRSPERDLEQALGSLRTAAASNASDPETALAVAEAHLWLARWRHGRGQAIGETLERGLEAVEEARQLNPRMSATDAVHAGLLRLLAATADDRKTTAAGLSEARSLLSAALDRNPYLRGRYPEVVGELEL